MTAIGSRARFPGGSLALSQGNDEHIAVTIIRLMALMLLDALGLILAYGFLSEGNIGFAALFFIITLMTNIFILVPSLYPIKWMSPGIALVTLLVIYPIIYTVLTAFTNYGDGHMLSKHRVAQLLEKQTYIPESARVYDWALFQNESGSYALWLTRESDDGTTEVAFAPFGDTVQELEGVDAEPPENYEGYTLLQGAARTQALGSIQNLVFGEDDDSVAIRSRNSAARPLGQKYVYDSSADTLTDQSTGTVYLADNEQGFFVPQGGGTALNPGFRVNVGLDNFRRLVDDSSLLEPLLDVFAWTVVFAFLSVFTTFSLGLLLALVLNDPAIPGRRIIRSFLIVPYAIPGVISILVWKGMLNQNLGIITNAIADSFGVRIPWFTDAVWAKVAIIIVNLYMGYGYMMLVSSGALQAIPSEVYEAAAVDGAKPGQIFWKITLPLLLVAVGPLLIASFIYNFNNFLLIDQLTGGNPPIPGTSTPAGYTDILISYTYDLAFGAGRGADYGYASTITIIIFMITVAMAMIQFRFTRSWEEIGENV